MKLAFSHRIVVAFAALLFGFSVLVAFLGHRVAVEHEQETMQRVSRGLAKHIVEHWPEVARPADGPLDKAALDQLLLMLMSVNPSIDVYVLDENGRVRTYIGDANAVRDPQVDIQTVRAFLAGVTLPLLGSDPKFPDARKIFSAAMFPPSPGAAPPPGYLYVVLAGEAHALAEGNVGALRMWRSIALAVGVGLGLTLLVGLLTFRYLVRPLERVAARMEAFHAAGIGAAAPGAAPRDRHDEVTAIEHAFDKMAARIATQIEAQAAQQAGHREVIANVAHDLRTPLTAMHGYLETLQQRDVGISAVEHGRFLDAAIAQSNKVRSLTQQLFELARLQSTDEIPSRERFRIDELVQDTVQRFELSARPVPVKLGCAPGSIEVEGDLQLIDRALTNLIDNAIRHGAGRKPVRVSVLDQTQRVDILMEDDGPGLPAELSRRLDAGEPLREPPTPRPGGGLGGLGLAIAQRIAWLHGGQLRTLPAPNGGTRLCLALPLVAKSQS